MTKNALDWCWTKQNWRFYACMTGSERGLYLLSIYKLGMFLPFTIEILQKTLQIYILYT